MTIYEILSSQINPKQIEIIELPDGYIEYRIWGLSTIAYNDRITNFGKTCTARYLEYNGEICFEEKRFIKDSDNEYFTEDEEFYESIAGIKNIHRFIGYTTEEIKSEIDRYEIIYSDIL